MATQVPNSAALNRKNASSTRRSDGLLMTAAMTRSEARR
jgi:hypothetical protein